MTSVTPPRRPVPRALALMVAGGLLLAGGTLPADATGTLASPPHRGAGDYGHTSAPDGPLRAGCHDYPYRYVLTPPTHDWTLETFLTDRTGQGVASGAYNSDSDPRRDRVRFRFCRYSVHAGRFTIRAKLHWYSADGTDHLVWLPRSHFRLHR